MNVDPSRGGDDDRTDRDGTPPKSFDSGVLVLATGGRASVFVGAVLVGISAFDAAQTLAVRASGAFPNDDAIGALFTLLVFAVGVVFLVQGAAGVVAEKRNAV